MRKTARKYRRLGRLPSELGPVPRWRTRPDPFVGVWGEIRELLGANAGLEAKTICRESKKEIPVKTAKLEKCKSAEYAPRQDECDCVL